MPHSAPTSDASSCGPWSLCALPAGSIQHPDQLPEQTRWQPAIVPGTVAATLAAAGEWTIDQPFDADATDWWYRTSFTSSGASAIGGGVMPPPIADAPGSPSLRFDGLASLAEVWLNGTKILTADNMFRSYRVEIANLLQPKNDLVIAFRSLTHALGEKRPRPRWKTNLVAQQQLRWRRTTLLGRIPGWSPPVPAVGPWRGIHLETNPIRDVRLSSAMEGDVGVVTFTGRIAANVKGIAFRVGEHVATAERRGDLWHAEVRIANPQRWWPHTHGEQSLYECSLELVGRGAGFPACLPDERQAGKPAPRHPLGRVGFRTIQVPKDAPFAIHVNGVPVYCRGACWTVSDIVTLDGSPETLAHDLKLAKAAGVNMLRIGGTMIYESDLFYELCDELGILIWQDFMFANMDYPVEDPAFAANIAAEASEQLTRLAPHPCIAVYCGNSEIEQQAAMLGMPAEIWRNRWFGERLPALCTELHPGIPYVPSSPSGGTLPFHVREGVAHYYGVGAYRRSLGDVRKDDVAFTTECLGFANIPEPATLNLLGDIAPVHHPRWKERVPRDSGAGWDFDDVRDFYLKQLFSVDPVDLRWSDPARYLQLSRVVPGEMMACVFAEWRSTHSRNSGGLVWFYKDLWPGAGWGIVDSRGVPKAPYYALRRAWATRLITITNEGLEGLHLHVVNEATEEFRGSVELVLLKDGNIIVARQAAVCVVAPRSKIRLSADAVLQGFYDVAHAYRFGPAKHDVAIASLLDDNQSVISEAHEFTNAREPEYSQATVTAEAVLSGAGHWNVTLTSDRFLHAVSFDVKGYLPEDNYFHVSPLRPRTVTLTAVGSAASKLSGYVEALNLRNAVKIAVAGTL